MTAPDSRPPPFAVTAQPGSRLEELLAAYEPLKAAAEEAAERFKSLTDAIKNEITAACPDGTARVSIAGTPGLPRLTMAWIKSWRVDSRKLKEEQPYLWVKYSKESSYWELRESK